MSKGKTRRLTRLQIDEVSAVSEGAGRGVSIVLQKAHEPRGYAWGTAYNLVKFAGRPKAKARHKASSAPTLPTINPAPAPAPVIEEHPTMPKEDTVAKAAIDAMSARVSEILKNDNSIRTTSSAIAKVAGSPLPADQELWRAYKQNSFVTETPLEPVAPAQSEAYGKLQERAQVLAKRAGISEVSAFARVYGAAENWDLVQADKAWNYAKMAGPSEPAEAEPAARTSHQIIDDERDQHLAKSLGLADDAAIVKAATATARRLWAELVRTLSAMYPQFGPERIRSLAASLQQHAPDLPRLGADRGYSGSPGRTTVG